MQKLPHWNNSTPSPPLSSPEQFLWLHSVAQINRNSLSASVLNISYSCVKNSSLLLFQSFPTLFLHQFDMVSSLHWCRYCQNHTRWRGSYNQKSRSHSKWVLAILYLCPPWHLFIYMVILQPCIVHNILPPYLAITHLSKTFIFPVNS